MDLLACCDCRRRFYLPGVQPDDLRLCPRCGGVLKLTRHGAQSIPLDARWLDPRAGPGDEAPVTVVALRRKQGNAGGQILDGLADYFAVDAREGSAEIFVNRGAADEAALRVAAVLDGIDPEWERHFYLPTEDTQSPTLDPAPPVEAVVKQLRRFGSNGGGARPEGAT